jgi:hypothetical protein
MIYDRLVNSLGCQQHANTSEARAVANKAVCTPLRRTHSLDLLERDVSVYSCLNNTSLPFGVLEFESRSIIPVTEGEMSSGTFFVAMTLLMEHIRCECVLLPDCYALVICRSSPDAITSCDADFLLA